MGYDAEFLGRHASMPQPAGEAVALDYTHFSIRFDPGRRLAAVTGANIHGGLLREVERGDDWEYDDRLPAEQQAGDEVYADNDFDRGHLVRRRDPCWGEPEVAEQANLDSFRFTNAAPQAADFNQSKELWNGLEDYLLGHATTWELRLSVFTGPVLAEDDPHYRGIQVPLRFWKVAAWIDAGDLAATGYLLDQSELAGRIIEADRAAAEPPPLGSFRTFQVPLAELAAIARFTAPALVAADRLVSDAARARAWRELTSYDDIRR